MLAAAAAVGMASLSAAVVRADPPAPLRIDYEGHEGCPGAAEFLRDVLARTTRARAAADGEPALDVWVRIVEKEGSRGRIVLWKNTTPRAREVSGATCGEVAEALALITALAVDPSASAAKATPTGPGGVSPPAGSAQVSGPLGTPGSMPVAGPLDVPVGPPGSTPVAGPLDPPVGPPGSVPWGTPGSREWAPPPWRGPVPAPPPERPWSAGAFAATGLAAAPVPLFGGGLFVERAFGDRHGGVARLSAELATTGTFDAGPGAASFLRGTLGLEGCPIARVTPWLSVGGCVAGEVGFLRAQGVARGEIASVAEALVPWASLGLRARLAVDLGPSGVLALDGGPSFPLVRRSFVFEAPDFTVFEVPAVTGSLRLSAGVRF